MTRDPIDLATGAGLDPETASVMADYLEALPDDDDLAALGVLVRARSAGGVVTVRSRRPRNLLLNWRKLALAGAGVAGGVVGTLAGGPLTGLALLGLGLASLPQLFELPDIELAELHSRVVEYLWQQDATVVPCGEVLRALQPADAIEVERALQDLEALRVIEILEDRAHKREKFIGLG